MSKDTQAPIGRTIAKKLSVSGLGWNKENILTLVMADKSSEHFLARFMGTATQPKPYRIKEGDRNGETGFGLIGQFQGVNGQTGEEITSAVCYLPEYATEMVLGALGSADDIVSVNIAFDIYARFDTKSATSYVFEVRDLLNAPNAGVETVKSMIKELPMPQAKFALLSS